jgi:holo-[acyl-carrier protein] synthase
MEVGIDIEQNERFKNVSQRVIERAFTKDEIAYAEKNVNKHEILCSFWCVKEAVVKALSNRALDFQQVNITATEEGRPYIIKNEYIINELSKLGFTEIKISISHAKDYSTAICIVY